MKDFCDLNGLSIKEINDLLSQAKLIEQQGAQQLLPGKVLALLFLNPSLRTLTSCQATMIRLGGGAFVISPEMSIHGLETRSGIVMDGSAAEHIREAVPVIASYADAIGIRAIASRDNLNNDLEDIEFNAIRDLCNIPVLNLESAVRHPCQSLADWKTLDDFEVPKHGGKLVFSWVYHPEALPLAVPGDTIHMAAARGMDVTVLRPEGFGLPEQIMQRAKSAALSSGGSISETSDRFEAFEGAHIVYAGSWSSTEYYGDRINDQKMRNMHNDWCIEDSWFDEIAADSCRFMHCLPVRRGVEVEDHVLDSPRSIVIRQARNRIYTQMSILLELFGISQN